MKVLFISLGCAKNLVNCEQMMALVRDSGHTLLKTPEGADVVVINTCGFIDSAKSEAIDNILQMAALKAEGQISKILVTGCLSQRYGEQILEELPEVDGVLGCGSYVDIVDALEEVIRVAHDSGVRVILNPAPVQALDDEIMALVDTVTPNETEAAVLTGVNVVDLASAHQAAQVFLSKGVRNVIITLGGNGVYCTDGTREELVERIPVQAVDTTGAGDAFNGGFITALTHGLDLFEAVRYGNCTGALSVTKLGTAPAMPHKEEIDALYQINYGG